MKHQFDAVPHFTVPMSIICVKYPRFTLHISCSQKNLTSMYKELRILQGQPFNSKYKYSKLNELNTALSLLKYKTLLSDIPKDSDIVLPKNHMKKTNKQSRYFIF